MNDLILLESVSARNSAIADLNNDRATEHLNKAKALVMAMWQGAGAATNQQMAEYFEVPLDAIESVVRRFKDELTSDGLKVVKGKDLKDVSAILAESQNRIPSLTVWTPRAALRLGMLLRDSDVAKQVRNVLLNIAMQSVPEVTIAARPSLPTRDAVEYIQAADILAKLPDSRLTRLLNQRLVHELSLENVNQKQIAPAVEEVKQYTTATVRASQLGYSAKQIGNGTSLGKFVKTEIAPDFSDWQGQYMVNHFEVNDRLDSRIHAYFLTRSL